MCDKIIDALSRGAKKMVSVFSETMGSCDKKVQK